MPTVQGSAEFFAIFGDQTRLQLMQALAEKPRCVDELVKLTGMTQPTISHSLKVLREKGAVTFKKSGRSVTYRIDAPKVREALAKHTAWLEGVA